MELALAIYGAMVGTAALAWAVYQWIHARRPDLLIFAGWSIDASGTTLQATVVNRGVHPVRVQNYAFRQAGVSEGYRVWGFDEDATSISPSDAAVFDVRLDEVSDWTTAESLVAQVTLTTGDRFISKPFPPPTQRRL